MAFKKKKKCGNKTLNLLSLEKKKHMAEVLETLKELREALVEKKIA